MSLRCADARDEPVHTGIAFSCLAFILVIVPHPVLRAVRAQLLPTHSSPQHLPQAHTVTASAALGEQSRGMPGGGAPERVVSAGRAPAHQVTMGVTRGTAWRGRRRPFWGASARGSRAAMDMQGRRDLVCSVVKRKTGSSTRRRLHTLHIHIPAYCTHTSSAHTLCLVRRLSAWADRRASRQVCPLNSARVRRSQGSQGLSIFMVRTQYEPGDVIRCLKYLN